MTPVVEDRALNASATFAEDVAALFNGRADLLDDPYTLYHRLRTAAPVYRSGP